MLKAEGISVRYGEWTILDKVSFSAEEGRWLMIVGPNGAGKSTIVNAVTKGAPYTGRILLGDREIGTLKPRELARKIGVLTQNHFVGYSFTVEEIVRMGRYAYSGGILHGEAEGDEAAVEEALRKTGMLEQRAQSALTLSGGELQRTFLAQVFAQDPEILLLDEPTNHLDLVYQRQVFGLIQRWLRETGRTVVSVVHDLSLALAYGTDALLLDKGHVVREGPVRQVLTRDSLAEVYGMDVYEWMRTMLGQWREEEE